MIEQEILDKLEVAARQSEARLTALRVMPEDVGRPRLKAMLDVVGQTILPRRLEFDITDGSTEVSIALQVNGARVTRVSGENFGVLSELAPEARAKLVSGLADKLVAFCDTPGQLQVIAHPLDVEPGVEDTGVYHSDLNITCGFAEAPPAPETEGKPAENPAERPTAKPAAKSKPKVPADPVHAFYKAALSFSNGRFVLAEDSADVSEADGACAAGQNLAPSTEVAAELARDLTGWEQDCGDNVSTPQMIIIRTSNPRGGAMTLYRKNGKSAGVIHEGRKLGAAAKLWRAMKNEGAQ